jgi:hypothetical protein
VVFGEIIAEVFTAGFPINEEMVLSDAVTHPIKAHVHGAGASLADGRIDDTVGGGVIGLDWGWWLRMAHFDESGTEDFGGLAVYI